MQYETVLQVLQPIFVDTAVKDNQILFLFFLLYTHIFYRVKLL